MGETVLLAGATGVLGSHVLDALRGRGYRVRALSRTFGRAKRLRGIADEIVVHDAARTAGLPAAVRGVRAIVSCVGAPTTFTPWPWRSYGDVDTVANRNLIDAARAEGVRRFVYAAVHAEDAYAHTGYVAAHEAVVGHLQRSGLSYGVVRPTGLFPIFAPFMRMARLGVAGMPGAGGARTNPVHPADAADACVELLDTGSDRQIDVGGPQVITREDIVRLAFRAAGRTPRIVHVPPGLIHAFASVLRPAHPRFGDLLEFGVLVFTHDCVAPPRGRRRLEDYFAAVASGRRPG